LQVGCESSNDFSCTELDTWINEEPHLDLHFLSVSRAFTMVLESYAVIKCYDYVEKYFPQIKVKKCMKFVRYADNIQID
jgi:hypothetical protein